METLFWISIVFFSAGFLGFCGCSFGPPLLARFFSHQKKSIKSVADHLTTLQIFIPAHNEEKIIAQTLQSLQAEASRNPKLKIEITVGLDACTDRTEIIALENGAHTFINDGPNGKWFTLNRLVETSTAEWIALVDCGSIWHAGLLAETFPHLQNENVMGVAPSYSPQRAGFIEKNLWKFEQALKAIESQAGGPVSVHGATVFYRREKLQEVLRALAGTHWLNDDVVVPFTMRARFTKSEIVYLARSTEAWVGDVGIDLKIQNEYRRRRRMVVGNLQWISDVLLTQIGASAVVTIIATRRVFRMFWAYWILFLVVGSFGIAHALLPQQIFLGGVAFSMIGTSLALRLNVVKRIAMAFVSGLQIPFLWISMNNSHNRTSKRGIQWA